MKHIKLFALLAVVTFFAGCDMLPNTAQLASGGSGDLIPVRVTLGDGNARTILPNMGEDFSKYKLVLSGEASGDNDKTAPEPTVISGEEYGRSYGNWVIALPEGEWIIHAAIQVTVAGMDYDMVKGSSSRIWVNDWSDNNANINIHMPETGGQGTFAYSVNYPAGGSATVTLQPFSNGSLGTAVINNAPAGTTLATQNVASGIYFLTVKATSNSKTVTRSEVVHIYRSLTSTASYTFTKLDFDPNATLKLSGTITIRVDDQQPASAGIYCSGDRNGYGYSDVNFTGNGNGTWEITMDNLGGSSTLYFNVSAGPFWEELISIPVPVSDLANINLGTINIHPVQLTLDTWHEGTFEDYGEHWYSVSVTSGQAYAFSWNDRYDGDRSKTADVYVQAADSNGYSLFDADSAWEYPVTYRANATGTIYLRVYGDRGTYAIKYATTTINVQSLTTNTWAEGNFTSYNQDHWYSMQVVAGQTYFLWSNDGDQGDGTMHGYIRVEVESPDGSFNYSQRWNSPRVFTAVSTDTVYMRVTPNGNPGTYAIAYSTIPVNPTYTAQPLTNEKTWINGDLGYGAMDWYSIIVTEDNYYTHFWLNTTDEGDGSKTANVEVTVYKSNGEYLTSWGGGAWFNSTGFYAETSGTFYLCVMAYDPGTYAIGYSTDYTSWFNPMQGISATPLAADSWTDGEFSNYDETHWYSITVTPDTEYYIWLNNVYDGDGSKTAETYVTAYDSDGNYLGDRSYAWNSPMYIYPSTSTVYLRVQGWEPGTYAIAHSADDTRP